MQALLYSGAECDDDCLKTPGRSGGACTGSLCGSGRKATELGAKLFGEGLLVANDISASRVKALLKNIEVMGIQNSFF